MENKRCIYVYEFNNTYAYVGLTKNLKRRRYQHKKKGTIYNFLLENNTSQKIIQLTDYLSENIAQQNEEFYHNSYKNSGWTMLNSMKTGNLGGTKIIWTYEKCKDEAYKHTTKKEFRENNSAAYYASHKNNWIDDVCSHMVKHKLENLITKEECRKLSKLYNTKWEFCQNYYTIYKIAKEKNWLKDICTHMKIKKEKDYWTYNNCKEKSKECIGRKDFSEKFGYAYKVSLKNKWLDDFFTKRKKRTNCSLS